MKAYWYVSYGFDNYELILVKSKSDCRLIEKTTKQLGAKILGKGELEIKDEDFSDDFMKSRDHKIKILVETIYEARRTKSFDPKLLEERLVLESN